MFTNAVKLRMERQNRRKGTIDHESTRMLVDEETHRPMTAPPLQTPGNARFLFVLHASPALFTAENEESSTYLNQGQSYQIKFRYQPEAFSLGPSSVSQFRTVIRLCFWDSRMQQHERELLDQWLKESHCSALFDVDMNSSYGILSVLRARSVPNVLEVTWSGDEATSLFVRFHCTSTDFAAKRHGGERGIPLRLQLDTYQLTNDPQHVRHGHSCSCKVQLFRLKGAQRKNKVDRIRLGKLKHDQAAGTSSSTTMNYTCFKTCSTVSLLYTSNLLSLVYPAHELVDASDSNEQCSEANQFDTEDEAQPILDSVKHGSTLRKETNISNRITTYSSHEDVTHWLDQHHFSALIARFPSYTGCDLLRLTVDDIRQICSQDQALSLRLYNQLHQTIVPPSKILYIGQKPADLYSAVYLHRLTQEELIEKLRELLGPSFDEIRTLVLALKKVQIIIDHDDVVKYSLPNEGQFHLKINLSLLTLALKDPDS